MILIRGRFEIINELVQFLRAATLNLKVTIFTPKYILQIERTATQFSRSQSCKIWSQFTSKPWSLGTQVYVIEQLQRAKKAWWRETEFDLKQWQAARAIGPNSLYFMAYDVRHEKALFKVKHGFKSPRFLCTIFDVTY